MGELDDEVRRQRQAEQLKHLWQTGLVMRGVDPVVMQPIGRTKLLVDQLIEKITHWDQALIAADPNGDTRALDELGNKDRMKRFGLQEPGSSPVTPKRRRRFQSQSSLHRQREDEAIRSKDLASQRSADFVGVLRATFLSAGATEIPGIWVTFQRDSGDKGGLPTTIFSCCVFSDGRIAPNVAGSQTVTPAELEGHADKVAEYFAMWLKSPHAVSRT